MDSIQAMLQRLGSGQPLLEIAAIALCVALAWLLTKLIARWRPAADSAAPHAYEGWRSVALPLIAAVALHVVSVLGFRTPNTPLINLVVPLLFSYAVVRLAVGLLRRALPPNALLKTSERAVAFTIWMVLVLHLLDWLQPIARMLDAFSIIVAKQEISLLTVLQAVLAVGVTLLIALWLGRWLEGRIMRQAAWDLNLRVAFTKVLRGLLLFVAVLIALPLVGIDVTALSVFGGALGVGIGFGLQKIASNYVSGFIILLDRSIRIGDLVTIDERHGVVSKIAGRYTVVRAFDGTESIIPNETMITDVVLNHSASEKRLLLKLPMQISYQSDVDTALRIMEQEAKRHTRTLANPPPAAFLSGFADSGINLLVVFSLSEPEQGFMPVQSDVYRSILREFRANNVSIPYPQREIRMLGAAEEKLR